MKDSETVSLVFEISEDLKLEADNYIESHSGMSFDEFVRLAISSLLSSTSYEYQVSAKAYLESVFQRSKSS